MTLATYADLKDAIASWLARDDLTSGQKADIITAFEAVANRRLRVRQMEASSTITMTSGVGSLPTDYLTHKEAYSNGDVKRVLEYADRAWLDAAYPSFPNDVPQYFTIHGDTLVTYPYDDNDVVLKYYQKIPALSDSNTSNWLLTAHPDLYLWGILTEANAFVMDEKALLWKQRRDELFNEITSLSAQSRTPSSIRVMGPVI